jgi:hypothetical protein
MDRSGSELFLPHEGGRTRLWSNASSGGEGGLDDQDALKYKRLENLESEGNNFYDRKDLVVELANHKDQEARREKRRRRWY